MITLRDPLVNRRNVLFVDDSILVALTSITFAGGRKSKTFAAWRFLNTRRVVALNGEEAELIGMGGCAP